MWRKRQRDLDIEILWPVCKQECLCLADARRAFFYHCCMDPAWFEVEDNVIINYINELE